MLRGDICMMIFTNISKFIQFCIFLCFKTDAHVSKNDAAVKGIGVCPIQCSHIFIEMVQK